MQRITLTNGWLTMEAAPQGAALLRLTDAIHGEILRPWMGNTPWHPGNSALFPMLPVVNRVAGNRYPQSGETIVLPKSELDRDYFLHGDGWSRLWAVSGRGQDWLELTLESQLECGFHYLARLGYRLVERQLKVDLAVQHLGDKPMLYGTGFHPFFTVTPGSRVQFNASGHWVEGPGHLPGAWQPGYPKKLAAQQGAPVAGPWINTCFSGWPGEAVIDHGRWLVRLRSAAPWLMVYRDGEDGFICLEPQSHPVDAHHMPGQPGLVMLARGQQTAFAMTISCEQNNG